MLILAFDCSARTSSVAVLQDKTVLYDVVINNGLNHSENLMPAIDQACRFTKIDIKSIELFTCTLGPGSFTGLRIGVSTLKGLLLATDRPASGVSSLAALALNVTDKKELICSVIDAGRGQVYTALFHLDDDLSLIRDCEDMVVDPNDISFDVKKRIKFVGDGARKYQNIILKKSKKYTIESETLQYIRASAVGILGYEKFISRELLEPASFVPVYLRTADAQLGKSLFEDKK